MILKTCCMVLTLVLMASNIEANSDKKFIPAFFLREANKNPEISETDTVSNQDFTTRDLLLLASINMFHQQVNSDCNQCRYFVELFQRSLQDISFSGEKPSARQLETVCGILMKGQKHNLRKGCVSFLSNHYANFSMYFSEYMKPYLVCQELGCQPFLELKDFTFQPQGSSSMNYADDTNFQDSNGLSCTVCKMYAKQIVEDILKDYTDPTKLRQELENICKQVPSIFRSFCLTGVNILMDHIPEIQKAGAEKGAALVCKLIKAC